MRILSFTAKCSDMFACRLRDNGKIVADYDGYVPNFFPGDHGGDYVCMDIDVDTGTILNWKVPTAKDLTKLQSAV